MIADYERQNVPKPQYTWIDGIQQEIVPILLPDFDHQEQAHGQAHGQAYSPRAGVLTGVAISSVATNIYFAIVLFYMAR